MIPKKKPKLKRQLRVDLDQAQQADLRKCTRLKLDDPQADYSVSPPAVIRWALRKCAAEVREG